MKKLLAMILGLLLILSMPALADESTWLTNEKVTFTAFATVPSNLLYTDDLDNNEFTKWYEDYTNVHIDWKNLTYGASGGDNNAKLNTMLASGDYPDLILTNSFSKLAMYQAGLDGVIIPLNDLIEQHAPNLTAIFAERPDIKAQWTAPDGNIYGLGYITEYYHGEAPHRVWIYEPWLKALDMEMPQTTDEYYNFLKAVKETDLNGNGEADEIPLLTMDNRTKNWLISSWIYFDSSNLMVEDGKISFVSNTEEYRDALRYIKRLYDEELIPMDVLTLDDTQIKAHMMWDDYKVGTVAAFSFGGMFTNTKDDDCKGHDMIALAPLEGPQGVRQIPKGTFNFMPSRFSITRNCQNPEIAIAWIDWMFNEENCQYACYGPQIEPDQNGIMPGWYKLPDKEGLYWSSQLQTDNPNYNNNLSWGMQIGVFYQPVTEANKTARMDGTFGWTEAKLAQSSDIYDPYKVNKGVPDFFMSEDGTQLISEYRTVINSIVDQYFAAFVTGTKDIESDWEAYLTELNNADLETYLEVYQSEYNTGVITE
jgi:putative aldouronate transport system substrate-binding protein